MNVNSTESELQSTASTPRPRVRLRMQPLSADAFSTFVYVCAVLLLIGEFIALFWLDIFA